MAALVPVSFCSHYVKLFPENLPIIEVLFKVSLVGRRQSAEKGSRNMLFRFLFVTAYITFVINPTLVLKLEEFNSIQKSLFLAAALAFVTTRKVDKIVISLLSLAIVMIFAQATIAEGPYFTWDIVLNAINQPIIFFALLAGIPKERDKNLLKIVAFLPIVCGGLGFLYQSIGISEAFATEYTTGLTRFGGTMLPAFLSGIALIGTYAAMQWAMKFDKRYFAVLGLDAVILLLAGGRTAIAATVIICGLTMMLDSHIRFRTRAKVLVGGMVGAIVLVSVMWDRLATRFSNGDNGRDIMAEYLSNLNHQYPTGVGFGVQFFSVPTSIKLQMGSFAAHNDFLRLTVELGWLGMLLFYLLYLGCVVRIMTRRQNRGNINILAGLLAFAALSLTDNALANPAYFPVVFLAYLTSLGVGQKRDERAISRLPTYNSRSLHGIGRQKTWTAVAADGH